MEFLTSSNARLIVLVLEAIILAGLFHGFYLIRVQRDRAAHERNQTFWVLLNLLPVLFVMAVSFSRMLSFGFTPPYIVGHVLLGSLIQLTGVYLILRMKNRLPQGLRVKNFKRLMQIILGLWTLQAVGGFYIYSQLYLTRGA